MENIKVGKEDSSQANVSDILTSLLRYHLVSISIEYSVYQWNHGTGFDQLPSHLLGILLTLSPNHYYLPVLIRPQTELTLCKGTR